MSIRFINHAAAEDAISATRAYVALLTDLTEALRHHTTHINGSWQGHSYSAFSQTVNQIVRQLEHAREQSAVASGQLHSGLDHAQRDEQEAEAEAQAQAQAQAAKQA